MRRDNVHRHPGQPCGDTPEGQRSTVMMCHQHGVGTRSAKVTDKAGQGAQVESAGPAENLDVEAGRPEVVGERAGIAQAHQPRLDDFGVEVFEQIE